MFIEFNVNEQTLREVTGDYTSPLGALVETECGWLAQSGLEVKKVVEELAQQSTADWEDDLTP